MLNIGVKRDKQLTHELYCNNTTSIYGYSISENIGNIGTLAMINIGVSAYRQKTNIGTPLIETHTQIYNKHTGPINYYITSIAQVGG